MKHISEFIPKHLSITVVNHVTVSHITNGDDFQHKGKWYRGVLMSHKEDGSFMAFGIKGKGGPKGDTAPIKCFSKLVRSV